MSVDGESSFGRSPTFHSSQASRMSRVMDRLGPVATVAKLVREKFLRFDNTPVLVRLVLSMGILVAIILASAVIFMELERGPEKDRNEESLLRHRLMEFRIRSAFGLHLMSEPFVSPEEFVNCRQEHEVEVATYIQNLRTESEGMNIRNLAWVWGGQSRGDDHGCAIPTLAGDGICDAVNNVEPCYDLGDCCIETCTYDKSEYHADHYPACREDTENPENPQPGYLSVATCKGTPPADQTWFHAITHDTTTFNPYTVMVRSQSNPGGSAPAGSAPAGSAPDGSAPDGSAPDGGPDGPAPGDGSSDPASPQRHRYLLQSEPGSDAPERPPDPPPERPPGPAPESASNGPAGESPADPIPPNPSDVPSDAPERPPDPPPERAPAPPIQPPGGDPSSLDPPPDQAAPGGAPSFIDISDAATWESQFSRDLWTQAQLKYMETYNQTCIGEVAEPLLGYFVDDQYTGFSDPILPLDKAYVYKIFYEYLDTIKPEITHNWKLRRSAWFVTTVLTTIGYGTWAPTEDTTRLFMIIFTVPGIVIFGVFLSVVTELSRELRMSLYGRIYRTFCKVFGMQEFVDPDEATRSSVSAKALTQLDTDGSGVISRETLVIYLTGDQVCLTQERAEQLWEKLRYDKDGHIKYTLEYEKINKYLKQVRQRAVLKSDKLMFWCICLEAVIYLLLGMEVFYHIEKGNQDWSRLTSLYFCLMTLTTVALGEFINSDKSELFWYVYVIMGLGMLADLLSRLSDILSNSAAVNEDDANNDDAEADDTEASSSNVIHPVQVTTLNKANHGQNKVTPAPQDVQFLDMVACDYH